MTRPCRRVRNNKERITTLNPVRLRIDYGPTSIGNGRCVRRLFRVILRARSVSTGTVCKYRARLLLSGDTKKAGNSIHLTEPCPRVGGGWESRGVSPRFVRIRAANAPKRRLQLEPDRIVVHGGRVMNGCLKITGFSKRSRRRDTVLAGQHTARACVCVRAGSVSHGAGTRMGYDDVY